VNLYFEDVCLTLLQSTEALEFIMRDLTEFSTVVQHDTTCSIVATATAVRNKLAVRRSLRRVHRFVGQSGQMACQLCE